MGDIGRQENKSSRAIKTDPQEYPIRSSFAAHQRVHLNPLDSQFVPRP